jgi:hypothetical protein
LLLLQVVVVGSMTRIRDLRGDGDDRLLRWTFSFYLYVFRLRVTTMMITTMGYNERFDEILLLLPCIHFYSHICISSLKFSLLFIFALQTVKTVKVGQHSFQLGVLVEQGLSLITFLLLLLS